MMTLLPIVTPNRERRYIIAYRHDGTDGEWVMAHKFTGPYARDHAYNTFNQIKADFQSSDLAIFFYWEGNDWHDGAVRHAAYNWSNKPISPALSNLINSRESDWF